MKKNIAIKDLLHSNQSSRRSKRSREEIKEKIEEETEVKEYDEEPAKGTVRLSTQGSGQMMSSRR